MKKDNKEKSKFKACHTDHGGSLKNPQKRKRPLTTTASIHLVLRSSKARGTYSLKRHRKSIDQILKKFAEKHRTQIISYANAGNHLHLHIKILTRLLYRAFIRAVTAAVMMRVTGFGKWKPKPSQFQFWDLRPFTRIVKTMRSFRNLVDYIQINYLEGMGYSRSEARAEVRCGRREFEEWQRQSG